MEVLKIQSDQHGVLDLTSMVKDIVEKSSVSEGLCCVFVPHTTAGLVIYSGIDPKGLLDLNDTVKTMVPVRTDFHHQCDPPSDAAGHIKSALFGNSITFIAVSYTHLRPMNIIQTRISLANVSASSKNY